MPRRSADYRAAGHTRRDVPGQQLRRHRGDFPKVSTDSLIEPDWVEAAQKRSLKRNRRPHLGIDVARYGDSETVVMRREASWARIAWTGGKVSSMETVGRVERVKRQLDAEPGLNDWTRMAVDADGVGGGVVDRLRELGHSVTEIHGGRPSAEPDDYVNLRSEWYWNLRQRFEEGDIDIGPEDAVLAKWSRS